jgi:hypothetical protein
LRIVTHDGFGGENIDAVLVRNNMKGEGEEDKEGC